MGRVKLSGKADKMIGGNPGFPFRGSDNTPGGFVL